MWVQAGLLLIVVGAVGASFMVTVVAAAKGWPRTMRKAAVTGAVAGAVYVLAVLAAGASAPVRTLGLGDEKYICELDCHLAYSVQAVRRKGHTLIVSLRVRFEPGSIRAGSRMRPLYPGARRVWLRDSGGTEYRPITLGDLTRPLRPGEAYTTELVFDVVSAAPGLVLTIADADPTKKVLLGSDTGPFRSPVGFRLSGN